MKVLVLGATGGTGAAVVTELLTRGHDVTAFSRHAEALLGRGNSSALHAVNGDATDPAAVDRVVAGNDAVVIALGITESPLRVRLRGPAHTHLDIRSRGTATAVAAMRRHGVRRLVVQSVYGIGPTAGRLRLSDKIFYPLLIGNQVADHDRQENIVRDSELEWTIVQPVHLNDEMPVPALVSPTGEVGGWHVPRATVGRVLADVVEKNEHPGASIAVSAARP
ncbi:NAD(P)-dependent oxidoreductase [Nocardia mexicana]|uniref:Putative NADH-flavin reductase n=1 Tax=Nocardia mexicana TaxID=279262 RepID=A0A370GKL8_9NOCA|nr:NAD(P)-binding oxidoreductase [Nocardia mexicana]RDI42483.1 putative NADH-flavin reductase [Nocardia mexicana]